MITFAEICTQTDAQNQQVTMTYDALGRMLTKTDATGTAVWVYDTAPGAGKGKLAAMVSAPADFAAPCAIPGDLVLPDGNRAVKTFQYDAFGDVQAVDECADGTTSVTSYQYDGLGRQSQIRYPVVNTSQLAVGYHYTDLGYLQYLTDDSSDYSVLWQAKAMNALGQVTDEEMRNGVETVSTRNPATGWLLGSRSTAHSDQENVIQDQSYTFDEVGNLLSRGPAGGPSSTAPSETFTYDVVNRLATSVVTTATGSQSDSYFYDALGNLTQKATNAYHYQSGCLAGSRAAGPHAVCSVADGPQFAYDGNGNLTNDGLRSIAYNPSNKVVEIDGEQASGSTTVGTVKFMYGADGNRVVQSVTSGTTTSRTVYVGLGGTGKSLYERTTVSDGATQTIQHVNFIYAGGAHGGNAFAIRVLDDKGTPTASRYYNFDHLGSITAMSDEQGHVGSNETSSLDPVALGYDAWGARRNPDGTAATPISFDLPAGHREFTGHEQIPGVGLVNMNGRVYNPALGRFLSPDPNVQSVSDLQTYNRYSYVLNNPLRYTDPTGYWAWHDVGKWFANTFGNPLTDFEILGSIAACAGSSGAACFVFGLTFAAMNAGVAIANGAGFDQTFANTMVGLGVGMVTGGIASSAGASGLAGLLVGSASAAITTGISNLMSGRSFLGYDMLGAAFLSAAEGAASLGVKALVEVSQAGIARTYDADPEGTDGDGNELGTLGKGRKGALYSGGDHDAIVCGERGIQCGGPADPKRDAIALTGLQQTHAVPGPTGIDGVDDVEMPIKDATAQTHREYIVLALKNKAGDIHYSDTEAGSMDEVPSPRYPKDEQVIAIIHTHPGSPGTSDFFSTLDANAAVRAVAPNYVWSQAQGKVMVFTPAAGNAPANIRYLP